MASNKSFGDETTAQEVVQAFAGEIKGKTVVVTGPSPGGIGAETARAIATQGPKLLILAGRDTSKLEETRASIVAETPGAAVSLATLDLLSLASVRAAAAEITKLCGGTLDVLINNAGIMIAPEGTTAEGFETQFGANYLGPWLLTNLLVPCLLASGSPRVAFVSSMGHRMSQIRWDDISFKQGYHGALAYGQSKTANILNAVALAERFPITAVSLHPGMVHTNLGNHLSDEDKKWMAATFFNPDGTPRGGIKFKTIPSGAATSLVAAFDPALKDHKGAYLVDCQVAVPEQVVDVFAPSVNVADYAVDKGNAERLWKLSEEMVGEEFGGK